MKKTRETEERKGMGSGRSKGETEVKGGGCEGWMACQPLGRREVCDGY